VKLDTGAISAMPMNDTKPIESGGIKACCGRPASIYPSAPAIVIGTPSPAEVATALSRAGLAEWVATLPDGVDTMVGDGHRGISGGERARLEWARALLADQPVLVLDEPTAHLDTATARRLTDDILEIRDRSIVWITHGTVGLDRMDQIVALDEQREDAGTASTLTRPSTAAAGGVSEALAVG